MPEVGRFASPDTLVPDPGNPQSFNRYSYVNNSPTNFTDPTGHCLNSYDAGSADLDTCLSALNSVGNYLAEQAYNSGGNFPNATFNDWLMNADIAMLENLMAMYRIDYGYTFTPPRPAAPSGPPGQPISRDTCQYWQPCYEPVVTAEEMWFDAFIAPGVSGSAAGIWYGTVGEELILNRKSGEVSLYGFSGQGAGLALGADATIYGGLIWNLESNLEYAGDSSALIADLAPLIGIQAQFFWKTGTVPFTGDTWGVAAGPSSGASFGLSAVQSTYTCQLGCR